MKMVFTREIRETLFEEIKECLTDAATELSSSNHYSCQQWTVEILKRLALLGAQNRQGLSCGVAPNSENKIGEWLYDLVWWENLIDKDGIERMGDVILVLESEWSRASFDLRYDFQKLIQAKAHLKVFISDKLDDYMESLLRADVECFAQKDADEADRYLFAIYDYKQKNFYFKSLSDLCAGSDGVM